MNDSSKGLVKTFGFYTAFLLVAGSMIGSGVFKKVAPMTAELGSAWLVLAALLTAGIISLMGALTNAEVAGLIAEPGGQYAYFKKMYGKPFSFLYGWSMMSVVQTATGASVAYVFAESLNALVELPRLSPELEALTYGSSPFIFTPFANMGVKMVTIGLLLTLTAINYVGVRWGGLVLKILASSVIVCIVAIILLCMSMGGGEWAHLQHSVPVAPEKASGVGFIGAFFAAMMAAFWSYEGWNTIGFMGGEIKDPYRNIPRALTWGTLFVILLYMLINFAYLYVLPTEQFLAIHAAENQIAAVEVVRSFLGAGGALFILVLIMMSTFNSTNTTIMGAPRIYYAMAQDGLFFKGASKVHPQYRTPSNALLIQGIWGSVLVLSGNFDQLTDMLIFAAFIFYGAGAFGVFVLRHKMKETPRPYKVFGYPFIPALFVIFCAALVLISVWEKPREAGIGTLLILSGIPLYYYMKHKYKDTENRFENQ
jgi:APA family basic amino acid/polyamine antiporter